MAALQPLKHLASAWKADNGDFKVRMGDAGSAMDLLHASTSISDSPRSKRLLDGCTSNAKRYGHCKAVWT